MKRILSSGNSHYRHALWLRQFYQSLIEAPIGFRMAYMRPEKGWLFIKVNEDSCRIVSLPQRGLSGNKIRVIHHDFGSEEYLLFKGLK